MGSYDPIVIAICGAVSLLALVILLTAARIRRSEEDRRSCAPKPKPVPADEVLTEDDHLALWTEELWAGCGTYAEQVEELTWFEACTRRSEETPS